MELKGSRTEKNLLAAFAGESQARNRYTFFASVAKKEGYEQISAIFQETANNEKEHAELFFKLLKGGTVEITASYPAGIIGTTPKNLTAAAEGVFVLEDWHSFGQYYDKTLMTWYGNFTKNWDKIKDAYDERFYRMWTYYLLSCAGSFRPRRNQLWQIVFSKKGIDGGYQRIRE